MSLRLRLNLALGVVMAITLLLAGLIQYRTLRRSLLAQTDHRLAVWAHTLTNVVDRRWSGTRVDQERLVEELERRHSPTVLVQLDLSDRTLYRSAELPAGVFSAPHPVNDIEYAYVGSGGGLLRSVQAPVFKGGREVATVTVAESLQPLYESLWLGVWYMVVGGLMLLALALLLVRLVVAGALLPLARVAGVADDIVSTGDVSRRVAVVHTHDEVERVAVAVNALVGRVEDLLAAQKRLLADTSHELRNPLTVICTDLDLLAQDVPAETRRDVVREAALEAERMRRLIRDLQRLTLSEMAPPPPPEPVRLDALVREIPLPASPCPIQVRADVPVLVSGSRDRLRQIVLNLVENATRYAHEKLVVTVDVDGAQARLTVEDDGPGIAPEHLPHLFDRFYQVDRDRSRRTGGAGLGLAIVKAHVESMHGMVLVFSTPGQGTRFECRFPLEPMG